MSEAESISRANTPATLQSLAADLVALGVRESETLLLHSSLSALGWVCGGAVTVIEALLRVLGSGGTLVMPAHSSDLSEPSNWGNPPVPDTWWSTIRQEMPAFDARKTPTRGMGVIAELFRTWPGALRSDHPTASMAAHGPKAQALLAEQCVDDPFGEESPFAKLYAANARILLLGVGHGRNTSLHFAERKTFGSEQARVHTGSPIVRNGRREWLEYAEPVICDDDFDALGMAFETAEPDHVRIGSVGAGVGRLLDFRKLVDFGAHWLAQHRLRDGRRP